MTDRDQVLRAIWSPVQVNPSWAVLIERIGDTLRAIEPQTRLRHTGGSGQISGCLWDFYVNSHAQGVGPKRVPWPANASRAWEVALSYRGPFVTATSWTDESSPPDEITDPKLVQLVEEIARSERLTYLDAHEAQAWTFTWDELQGDASMRLDWSDTPTAFNLLFYEY